MRPFDMPGKILNFAWRYLSGIPKSMLMQIVAIFILAIVLSGDTALGQSTEWHESDHWRLYNVAPAKFNVVSLRSLARHKGRELAEDSMRAFMAHPTRLAAAKGRGWKAAFVATCELDEAKRKIDLSPDGTMFFDEYDKAAYQMAPEVQKAWAAYLAACSRSLRSH